MSEQVRCTVCHSDVGRGPSGLGITAHAARHRREFEAQFGRRPDSYAEVRERLGTYARLATDQATLQEALLDDEQATL